MTLEIHNRTKNSILSGQASAARTFIERLVGLLNRDSLDPDEALIFYDAPSIHMFFMRFPIDVIFLNKDSKILKIFHNLQPWQTASCFRATTTIELPAGKCVEKSTEIGDFLDIKTPQKTSA